MQQFSSEYNGRTGEPCYGSDLEVTHRRLSNCMSGSAKRLSRSADDRMQRAGHGPGYSDGPGQGKVQLTMFLQLIHGAAQRQPKTPKISCRTMVQKIRGIIDQRFMILGGGPEDSDEPNALRGIAQFLPSVQTTPEWGILVRL
jgi:hypothetical protein